MQRPELIKPVLNPPPNILRVTDQAGLQKLTEFFARVKAEHGGVLGWDIETTPVKDFFHRKVRTIQFGTSKEQYVIDLRSFCRVSLGEYAATKQTPADLLYKAQGYYGKNCQPQLKKVLDAIEPVICSKDFLKVGVNLGFEYMTMYWNFGLRSFNFYDCMMAEKCIYAGMGGHASMKNYAFFSMESMMERYFGYQIDKELQESFDLDCDLTPEQDVYATLDTRFPLAIRMVQMLICSGATYKSLKAKGSPAAVRLEYIDPLVTGDKLDAIVQVENDAIGAFQDMHVHGERLDRDKWNARIDKAEAELKKLISDVLDPIFIPAVGVKSQVITDADIEAATAKWKAYNIVTDAELKLKAEIQYSKKMNPLAVPELEAKKLELENARKAEKEIYKKQASELGKRRTAIKKLIEKCEGNALINYGSNSQLLAVIQKFKGLAKIENLDDETLQKYKHISVIAAIAKYHELSKEIGTYGKQWSTEWVTKPCKEEGWLNPGDGRLHCVFNQYDAETGRSSSEKPNGQNLPQDKEVRGAFIADAPDENVRISTCCDADTKPYTLNGQTLICQSCWKEIPYSETKAEEYVLITCDMSGAELRIIAELANDPIWIGAFERGEDVHSVGTEILYAEEWPKLALPDCAYYKKKENGEPQRKKCKCPEHMALRDATKAVNFLLAYGGGPQKLAQSIGKSLAEAKKLMELHSQKFPAIWAYLEKSGLLSRTTKKSFDMFGRRRIFPEPTRDRATEWFIGDNEEKLRLPEEDQEKNIELFTTIKGRKPDKEELYTLTHRKPTDKEISKAMMALSSSIGRQGKNHAIQGTNATIAKVAMGAGYCKNGLPFLWHTLPKFKAKLIKFVHDELVVSCPKRFGQDVANLIKDAYKRAAAERMVKVIMESEANIATYWSK